MAKKIGELLVEKGVITKNQLDLALKRQSLTGEKFGYILVKLGFIDEEKFYTFLAEQYNVKKYDKDEFIITKETQNYLSLKTVFEKEIIPIEKKDDKLLVGFSNFAVLNSLNDIEFEAGCKVVPYLLPDNVVKKILSDFQNFPYGLKDYHFKSFRKYVLEKYGTYDIGVSDLISLIDDLESEYNQIMFVDSSQPLIKKSNSIYKIDYKIIKHSEILKFIKEHVSDINKKKLVNDNLIKFILELNSKNYICSILKQKNKYSLILNPISKHIPDIMDFDLDPAVLKDLISLRGGLYIVASPIGHGKTTFMSSLANYFSKNTNKVILFLDEFILYDLSHDNSFVMQIEIGNDVDSLSEAVLLDNIINANLVFVSSIKNYKDFLYVLQMAEAGKKVFMAVDTPDITSAISYIISMIEVLKDVSIKERFANVLRLCIAQRLVNLKHSNKKLYLYEYLKMSLKMKRFIIDGAVLNINSQVKGSSDYIPLEKKFAELIQQRFLDKDDIFNYSLDYDLMKNYLKE